jgi:hypothetical protein
MAYLFAFPMVTRYGDMYRQAIDTSSPTYSGGFGTWRHVAVRERRNHGSGRPHETVLYSSSWLDLRSEPWWCTIDTVAADVRCAGRWVDLWGFLLDTDRTAHSSPVGSVLASAPRRMHDVPLDIDGIVRGESGFVALLTETRWRDPYALPAVEPIQPEIVLEPMSVHRGRAAPTVARTVDWWPWSADVETSDAFWSCANFALTLITPNPQDQPVLDRIAGIGVGAGRRWDASMFSDEVAEAIRAGVDDALSDLMEAAVAGVDREPGHIRRAEMDRDYFGRAVCALYRVP